MELNRVSKALERYYKFGHRKHPLYRRIWYCITESTQERFRRILRHAREDKAKMDKMWENQFNTPNSFYALIEKNETKWNYLVSLKTDSTVPTKKP